MPAYLASNSFHVVIMKNISVGGRYDTPFPLILGTDLQHPPNPFFEQITGKKMLAKKCVRDKTGYQVYIWNSSSTSKTGSDELPTLESVPYLPPSKVLSNLKARLVTRSSILRRTVLLLPQEIPVPPQQDGELQHTQA